MSLEPKEREDKFTELSSSSSSSMDEKDYVDVQGLIKSSAEQQQLLNKETVASDIDTISQLLTKQFTPTDESKITIPVVPPPPPTTTTSSTDQIRLENIILHEPDSTTHDLDNEVDKISKELIDISNKIEKELEKPTDKQENVKQVEKPTTTSTTTTPTTTDGCAYCAYWERFVDLIYFHPKVDDILSWKDPKISGGLLAVLLISLISFATFSLLSIVGFTLLALMTLIGGYRLYAFGLFKFKGQSDDTINKLLALELRLPKDEIQSAAKFIESNGNKYLNKLKQIVLWEDVKLSGIAYLVAYVVYSLGCAFNTITLLIFLVIDAFTLPKVYKMYKVPIDQFIKKIHDQSVDILSKIKEKVPFLNKKKLQ